MEILVKRLTGVRAKIERARRHIRDLEIELSAFRENNRHSVVIENDVQAGEKVHRVRFITPLPDSLPLIAGDTVHNLRSALDHLAWQLVERHGQQAPTRDTSYPIYSEAAKFHSRGAQRKIQGIDPAVLPLIEATQPYHTGYDGLGVLSELDNFVKHKLLIVAAAKLGDIFYGLGDAGVAEMMRQGKERGSVSFFVYANTSLYSKSGSPVFLKDGDILARVPPLDGLEEYAKVNANITLAFCEPQVVEGRAILPLLTQLAELVERVVDQFIPFL